MVPRTKGVSSKWAAVAAVGVQGRRCPPDRSPWWCLCPQSRLRPVSWNRLWSSPGPGSLGSVLRPVPVTRSKGSVTSDGQGDGWGRFRGTGPQWRKVSSRGKVSHPGLRKWMTFERICVSKFSMSVCSCFNFYSRVALRRNENQGQSVF